MIRDSSLQNNSAWLRLVALWVLAESFLGGLLHGLKLPVTGLLVGGSAMLCIQLIAWHFPNRGSVLKAMIIVMLMKFSLSPHSPFPAYLAVLFQGISGEFLLRGRRFFLLKCLFFGLIGMMESALQRLLVLIFLSGTEIWEALDMWISKVSSGLGPEKFSHWLALAYLLVHALAGLVLGILGHKLASSKLSDFPHFEMDGAAIELPKKPRRKNVGFAGHLISLLALAAWLLLESGIFQLPGKAFFIVPLLLRMVWLYGILVYLLIPLLDGFFRKFLAAKAQHYAGTLEEIRKLLPEMLSLLIQSRDFSRQNRLGFIGFLRLLIFNILYTNEKHTHPDR